MLHTTISFTHADILKQTSEALQNVQNANNSRFNKLELAITAGSAQRDSDAQRIASLEARCAQLDSGLSTRDAMVYTPQTLPDSTWDRQPDHTIACINCPRPVSKASVLTALSPHLTGITTLFSLEGPLGKEFSIKFQGDLGGASLRASKYLKSLASPTPGGGPPEYLRFQALYNGSSSPLYIGPDKSPKQRKLEYHIKKLGEIVKTALPSHLDVFISRLDGNIKIDRISLCRIEVAPSPAPTKILWNPSERAKHAIDSAELNTRFQAAVARASESIDWSLS